MDKMTWGAVLFIVGVGFLVLSPFADGIGIGNNPVFGEFQTIGTVAGTILTASGLYLMIRGNK